MEYIFSFFQQGFVYISACVLLLGVLIFVHEFGHFAVARLCGVRVEVFSLGFGKKIWQRVHGDTTYCISLIPLGGYVKMYGEHTGDVVTEELKAVSFTHKSVSQRIAIVLAGPLMNLLFAFFIFVAVAAYGIDSRSPALGDITPSSAAAQLGFQSGDTVAKIDGAPIKAFDDMMDILTQKIGQSVSVEVVRETGETAQIQAPVSSKENPNPLSLDSRIGDIEGLTSLSRAPVVGVVPGSVLWNLGLRSGDTLTEINSQPVKFYRNIEKILAAASEPVSFTVERPTEAAGVEKLNITLAKKLDLNTGMLAYGLESSEFYISRVVEKSPAQLAGIQVGDRLVTVNDKKITKWEDLLNEVKSYSGQGGVAFTINRAGKNQNFKIEPQMTSQMTMFGSEDKRYTIGVSPFVEAALPALVTVKADNPIAALKAGAVYSWDFSVITILSFVRLFQNKISPKTVGGLLSIGQAAGETMKLGLSKFLMMMAIISINLFVLNLLPIPVLDGGHLVFYVIEAIKGSPLSIKKVEFAQQIGLVLLMGLMVFAMFNDVTRLIFGRL
jgi:regulator of sigma E protease